jgi:SSS family solute:Na+ symporter
MRAATCLSVLLVCAGAPAPARAGESPRTVEAWRGSRPVVDGVLAPGEWDDAAVITGTADWMQQFSPTTDARDLSLRVLIKHDGRDLFFAFDVTDDVVYGFDTPRWLPQDKPHAHELTPRGYPWFGDGVELLVNADNRWDAADGVPNRGDSTSWQMVASTHKSRVGGVGRGGLLEGEERKNPRAWKTYAGWIAGGAMTAAVKLKQAGAQAGAQANSQGSAPASARGYVIEWRVRARDCLHVGPRKPWSPRQGVVRMGLNIGVNDLDRPEDGRGNFAQFHHEDWWAGEKDKRTWPKQWGTLVLHPGPRPKAEPGATPVVR